MAPETARYRSCHAASSPANDNRFGVVSDTLGNTMDYGFDSGGRTVSEASTIAGLTGAKTASYVLDDSGNRTKLTWPDGYYVGYCYDSLNRMTVAMANSVDTACNTTKLATYTYNPLSRRTNLAYGGGATVAYAYRIEPPYEELESPTTAA